MKKNKVNSIFLVKDFKVNNVVRCDSCHNLMLVLKRMRRTCRRKGKVRNNKEMSDYSFFSSLEDGVVILRNGLNKYGLSEFDVFNFLEKKSLKNWVSVESVEVFNRVGNEYFFKKNEKSLCVDSVSFTVVKIKYGLLNKVKGLKLNVYFNFLNFCFINFGELKSFNEGVTGWALSLWNRVKGIEVVKK